MKDKTVQDKISYPLKEIILSPFLHERIKELFELKHEKQGLKLLYDNQEQVLVGCYSDAIHNYRYIIYCDSQIGNVSIENQSEILLKLKEINKNKSVDDIVSYEPMYFYFIQKGLFNKNNNENELKCYNEDEFVNIIIDFSIYLRKNIDLFEDNLSDIGKINFKESFILPKFNKGKSHLEKYLDVWLAEKSYKHISLLADYGMGKTTFLKYYTYYLSKNIIDGKEFLRYPVFISLTNTSPMSNDGIQIKVQSFVAKELGVNYALFERLIHLGKIVFILDGFDEMGFIGTEKTRFDQFNSIWQLATLDNKILISGRPSYLPTEFERKNVLHIVDKDLESIQQSPYTEVIELDYFQEDDIVKTLNIYYNDQNIVQQYLIYIKNNKSIFDLCKRPSMLHMTMSILPSLYREGLKVNINATSLMNKYIEFWISRQESKNIKGYLNNNDNRKKSFIVDFFTDLASQMYEEQTLLISKTKLDKFISQEIDKLNQDLKNRDEMFEGFKNEIYTGYFIEVDINYTKEDNFRFVHKSIFEFFVAKKIINLIDNKDFNNKLWVVNWNKEIIDFIDSAIEHISDSKYPSLIALRNSKLDKILLLFTSITVADIRIVLLTLTIFVYAFILYHVFYFDNVNDTDNGLSGLINILLILCALFSIDKLKKFISKRFNFISKAYFISAFKNNYILTHRRLQHFLDFYSLFKQLSNLVLNNYTFSKNKFVRMTFLDSVMREVTFNKCDFFHVYFQNIEFHSVSFIECKISYVKFDNCILKNIAIDASCFKRYNNDSFLINNYKIFYYYSILFDELFHLNFKKVYFELLRRRVKKIVFSNMTIDNFDEQSIYNIKQFIKINQLKRKNIICDNKLKEVLFDG